MEKLTKNPNGISTYEYPVRKTQKKFNFFRGIYNKDKNYILGRTPKNWGELFVFYSIFYLVLAILCAICMKVLFSTLDDKIPKYTLDESRIGSNPGLGFRPLPKNLDKGSLIWFSAKNETQVDHLNDLIEIFLQPYKNATALPPKNSVNCNFGSPPAPGKVCRVNLDQFKNCTASNSYGYNQSQPCIFLKLNRIFNWVPQPYKPAEGETKPKYPENMPANLKTHIDSLPESEKHQIFVTCDGERTHDKEIIGDVSVTPEGFPHFFYPYTNEDNYLSPLIAVQFKSPKRNEVINVECIAWAANIAYHGGERDRVGSVHFELLID